MRLAEHWALSERDGAPLACIVADVDNFKRFNDTHGHSAGDAALQETTAVLTEVLRAGEALCRIGGGEFLIICPRSTARSAEKTAECMRAAVAKHMIASTSPPVSLTISLGVAERNETMDSPDELILAAESALYAAKERGKNRTCVAGRVPAPRRNLFTHYTAAAVQPVPLSGYAASAPLRVVVADDDSDLRALCRTLLEREGHQVSEATSGNDLLKLVARYPPDVIVMDVRMPEMDGLECMQRLKAGKSTKDIPVIMLSGAADAGSIEAGLEAGADDYITKPFRHREFALRVRSLARLHRSKNELIWSNEVRWEQARVLQVLFDLSCRLVGSSDLDTILQSTVAAAAELTLSRRVSIMLPDAQGAFLRIAKCVGLDDRTAGAVRVPVGAPIAGQVFATREPVLINNPDDAKALGAQQYDSGFFVEAPFLSKAMLAGDRVIGVLNIAQRHRQHPFTPAELEFVELLCNVAAAAINDHLSSASRDRARDSVVVALATLTESRDLNTGRHLDRVTRYAVLLAEELRATTPLCRQIDDDFLQSLRRAMPLHDIGKVAIPDRILLKPGRLTAAEMAVMKQHADLGAKTIQSIIDRGNDAGFLVMARQIARHHHERYDGSGYPDALRGDQIPLVARIATLADVYDALSSRRPYKDAIPSERLGQLIRRASGTQFDPAVVEAFNRREAEFAAVASELADDDDGGDPVSDGLFIGGFDEWGVAAAPARPEPSNAALK